MLERITMRLEFTEVFWTYKTFRNAISNIVIATVKTQTGLFLNRMTIYRYEKSTMLIAMQITLGKFENPLNMFIRVISHEHMLAKKPIRKTNPIRRTVRLLDRNLMKHIIANSPSKIVCNCAVRTNCSRVIDKGQGMKKLD